MQQPRDFRDAELAKATEMAAELEKQNNVETLAAQEEALCAEERDLAAAEKRSSAPKPIGELETCFGLRFCLALCLLCLHVALALSLSVSCLRCL